ncbi:MAG: TSUP family transporter [Chitinivibrionales bacterium]|nr:TSUP family transporter [Chitinivibrionales bacterium]
MIITLFCISIVGGFLSGLLGLGGAVVMIPLMLTVPPLFDAGNLSMKAVAGLSMIQVLAASLSGIIVHSKNRFVHNRILLCTGIPMGAFSLAGSYVSKYMDNDPVMILFGLLVVTAFFLLLFKRTPDEKGPELEEVSFNPVHSATAGAFVGTCSGIVGAGGGFILVPIMIILLKIPVKITVGTSLGIVFIGALFGALGKMLSLQVEYAYALPVIIGSIAASQFGARVSKITPPQSIKFLLLFVIILSIFQVWLRIFGIL